MPHGNRWLHRGLAQYRIGFGTSSCNVYLYECKEILWVNQPVNGMAA
jgi:hypothetical protein